MKLKILLLNGYIHQRLAIGLTLLSKPGNTCRGLVVLGGKKRESTAVSQSLVLPSNGTVPYFSSTFCSFYLWSNKLFGVFKIL